MNFLLYLILPPLIFFAKKRWLQSSKFFEPLVVAYGAGICMAHLEFLAVDNSEAEKIAAAAVAGAIPAMLFSLDFRHWARHAGKAVFATGSFFSSVVIVALIASLFLKNVIEDHWAVIGMLVGTFTGSGPNLAAVGLALNVDPTTLVLVQAADVVVCGLFFFFLVTFGISFFYEKIPLRAPNPDNIVEGDEVSGRDKSLKNIPIVLLFVVICVAVGGGLGLLFESHQQMASIVGLTLIAVFLAFIPTVNRLSYSFETGEFFFLYFCVAAGSMTNFGRVLESSSVIMLLTGLVMIGAILLHLSVCYLFRIDRATFLVTFVGGIYSPAMMGPVVSLIKNRQALISGIASGIIGLAIGNFLGIAIAWILRP